VQEAVYDGVFGTQDGGGVAADSTLEAARELVLEWKARRQTLTLTLVFSTHAGRLARTMVEEKHIASPFLVNPIDTQFRTIERRPPLCGDEKQFIGNPAKGQGGVKVGDPVVQRKDLPEFVKWYAASVMAEQTPTT
jgi:hypothetical protein